MRVFSRKALLAGLIVGTVGSVVAVSADPILDRSAGAASNATLIKGPGGGATDPILNSGPAVVASPVITRLFPYNNAHFVTGQRFDIRAEYTIDPGATVASFALTVDGSPVPTNLLGAGYTSYAYSTLVPGPHTITATLVDSNNSTATLSKTINVIAVAGSKRRVKNIIIFLGDGMGTAHRTAARLVKFGVTEGTPNGALAMDNLPGTGFVSTHSLNSIITDSAPGMACYSSGIHDFNGQEGVFPDNTADQFDNPRIEYMGEFLHRTKGASLGIVSTADIEDATPAANMIHTGDRGLGTGIINQYFLERGNSDLRVLLGGGRNWFIPKGQFGSRRSGGYTLPAAEAAAWGVPNGSQLADTDDIIAKFTGDGYAYAATGTDLAPAASGANVPDKLLGLFGYGNMNVALDKIAKKRNVLLPGSTSFAVDDYYAPDQPMLDDMTKAALNVLKKNANGFVLMVEGAHIDKQSHYMDADRATWETIEFDNAVAEGRKFADANPDTLVIVTADHECGGLSIIGALNGTIANLQGLASDVAVTSPTTTPARQGIVNTYDAAAFPKYTILADGYPSTPDIDGKLLQSYGANGDRYEGWLSKPLPVIDSLLSGDIKKNLAGTTLPGPHRAYASSVVARQSFDLDPFGDSRGFFLRGAVTGGQAVHTASDVPIYSYSSGSNVWTTLLGTYANVDVFVKALKGSFGGY